MSVVEADSITHRYTGGSRLPALDDVSLAVRSREILAIVGESGCGKTTLGKLLAGLLRPSMGQVRFEGRDIWRLKGRERQAWRRSVQLVHQDPYGSLNPGLNLFSTLGPALVHHKLAKRRDLQDRLLAIMGQVGLDATPAFLRRYPHQLSGGQRQRVAIARAVSLQPRVIVADEVTSMLDVSMRVSILDLLLSFREDRGVTYLFISHDFGVVRYFAQGGRIMVMFYGVVVEEGPTEELISRPQHPYTYLLLASIPVPDPDLAERRELAGKLEHVDGEPAAVGCVFCNRCPFVEAQCRTSRPPLVELRPGHLAACFLPERVPQVTYLAREAKSRGEGVGAAVGAPGPGAARARGAGEVGRAVEG